MNIWDRLYEEAKKEYKPQEVSPFIRAHHIVAAIEAENGEIFTGYCIEGENGEKYLCAEKVAALKMYMETGQTEVKRLISFGDREDLKEENTVPCKACRELFMQLNEKNKDIEIMLDHKTGKTTTLKDLMPNWWGYEKYEESKSLKS